MRKIPFDCKSAPFFGGGPCKPFDIHEILLIVSHAASDDGDCVRAELIQCFSLFFFHSQTFDKSPRQNDEVASLGKRVPDYFLA